jgi:murein tripeptide amidase MpaA
MAKFLVRITARSYEELRGLDKYNLDLKKRTAREEDTDRFVVSGILTEQQIEQVRSAGYIVEILSDLTQVSRERMQDVSRENRFSETRRSSELRESAETGGYMNADEVETALLNLSNDNPSLITLIELPNRTWNGRICRAVRVRAGIDGTSSNNSNNGSDRIGVLITGSMHAREWGGSDICINFLVNLIDAYLNNTTLIYGETTFPPQQLKNMLERIDLFVFPDVNPDGKIYSQTNDDPNLPPDEEGIWWRKNRNPATVPNGDNRGYHLIGVDINRNFDFLWNTGIGTVNPDGTHSSETYKGIAAFSEPETKSIKYLFDTYSNIKYYVDIHSFGEMILYSWGDDDNQSIDHDMNFQNSRYEGMRGIPRDFDYKEFIDSRDENTLKTLAGRMNYALERVRGRKYRVQQAVGLYPTSGTSDDYVFSRHIVNGNAQKIYGFTIEFGKEDTGFIPPFSEMQNVIKEVSSALTELCQKLIFSDSQSLSVRRPKMILKIL